MNATNNIDDVLNMMADAQATANVAPTPAPTPKQDEPSVITEATEWTYNNVIAPIGTTIADSAMTIGNDLHADLARRIQVFKKDDTGTSQWTRRIDSKKAELDARFARMGFK